MKDTNVSHPSREQLAAFDQGLLPYAERAAVESHVAVCDQCCGQLDALADDPLVALLRTSAGTPRSESDPTAELPRPAPDTPPDSGDPEVPAPLAAHPRYQVLEPLGTGGMGTVFKAVHRLMERTVALKVMRKELLDRPTAVERFRQEVKAAARLAHPNIVTAHDADQAGDVHFLVMEYVEGTSLDRLLRPAGLGSVAEVCDWVRQAALGLQHAFERGMVHRDIKPANLLLTPEGQVKILDFGLARFASESAPEAQQTPPVTEGDTPDDPARANALRAGLTPMGAIVGTPEYVAPEQVLDPRRADIRADIYSLGCTFYHLLTGRPPFAEGTVLQKLLAHQERPPQPLIELRDDVPAELADVVERMLAKDPDHRFQTPAEVAAALTPFVPHAGPPAATAERSLTTWGLALFAVLLLLGMSGLVAGVGWYLSRGPAPELPDDPLQKAHASSAPKSDAELRCLGGQTGPFTSVAFTRDCGRAVVAGADHTLRLWDLARGEEVGRLPGHTDTVLALAIAPDGRRAVSGGRDRVVRVWDLNEQRLLGTLERHTSWVQGLAFAWDSRHAVSCGSDGRVVLWDTESRETKGEMLDDHLLRSIALNRGGRVAITAGADKTLRVWDFVDWKMRRSIPLGDDTPACALWSRDSRYFVCGVTGRSVRLYRDTTRRLLRRFEGHTDEVRCLALTPDNRWILSGGADGTVRLWDVDSGTQLACFEGHADAVLQVAFAPDGRRAMSGGKDGTLRVWQLPVFQGPVQQPGGPLERDNAVAIAPDGSWIARTDGDEQVKIGSMSPWKVRKILAGHTDVVWALARSADGTTLASAGADGTVRLWDMPGGTERHTLKGHTGEVYGVALTADGRLLASGGADRMVRLWDADMGKELLTLSGHAGAVRSVALTADGATLASCGDDQTVKLWNLAAWRAEGGSPPVRTLEGHGDTVWSVAFSADGRTLAFGDGAGTVRLWDVAERKERATLRGHAGAVWAVAISADDTLASGSTDRTIRLWNAQSGDEWSTLRSHHDGITSLSFTADSKTLMSNGVDGSMREWEIVLRKKP